MFSFDMGVSVISKNSGDILGNSAIGHNLTQAMVESQLIRRGVAVAVVNSVMAGINDSIKSTGEGNGYFPCQETKETYNLVVVRGVKSLY